MPRAKVTGKARKATSGKPTRTFTCACTGGCKGRIRELSEALYKKHAKFRELDEATDNLKGNDLASPQQANIQYSQHDHESVSFKLQFKRRRHHSNIHVLYSVL
jgi:hypothetical protein